MSDNKRPDEAPGSSGDTERTETNPPEVSDNEATSSASVTKRDKSSKKSAKKQGRRGAVVLAVLAILLAVLAIAAVVALGYLGKQRAQSLGERVTTAEQAVETTTQDVILPKIDNLKAKIGTVANKVEQHSGGLSRLREDLRQTQTQVTDLTNRVQGGMRRWKLMEIEDLLLAASRQLLLEHDAKGARQALEIANRQLAHLNDPRLFDVRRIVINELAALEAMPNPDIAGLALRLTTLLGRIDQFPLAADIPNEYNGSNDDIGSDQSGAPPWKHFLISIREALQGMLTIRRSGTGSITPLMPPKQAFFLRQNLQLKLQTAKLALLHRNPAAYRAGLSSARQWLRRFFNTDDPAVAAAIEQLGQMQKVRIGWDAPEISNSLTALREFLANTRPSLAPSSDGNNTIAKPQNGGGKE